MTREEKQAMYRLMNAQLKALTEGERQNQAADIGNDRFAVPC